jgi:hypothetical protein
MSDNQRWRLYAQDFTRHRFGDKKPPVEMQTFDTRDQAQEKADALIRAYGADYLITIVPEPAPRTKVGGFDGLDLPKIEGGMRLTK